MSSLQCGFLGFEENIVLNYTVLTNIVLNIIINPKMVKGLAIVIGSRMLEEPCCMLADEIDFDLATLFVLSHLCSLMYSLFGSHVASN